MMNFIKSKIPTLTEEEPLKLALQLAKQINTKSSQIIEIRYTVAQTFQNIRE